MDEFAATVIIPQFHHAKLTCGCLRSLREHDAVSWPVVIVDDGSPPAACETLYRRLSAGDVQAGGLANVRIIEQQHAGVTAAWNLGAAASSTPFLVFLNNDVVSEGAWVERLIAPLRTGDAVMTGAAVRQERRLPAKLLETMGRGTWGDVVCCGPHPRPLSREERGVFGPQPGAFLAGWCFAVAADWLEAGGGFDERLRVYWSDTDLQLRASRLVCVRGLPLRHLGHRTAHDVNVLPNRRAIWKADRSAFVAKWGAGEQGSRGNCKMQIANCKMTTEKGWL